MIRVAILIIGLVGVVSSVWTNHTAGFMLSIGLVTGALGYG